MCALATAESEPAAWPDDWVAVAPACSAVASALQQDLPALSALLATAFASNAACCDQRARAAAVKTLGTLLQASAVRALFPVPAPFPAPASLPALCDAETVSVSLVIRDFAQLAAGDFGACSAAAAYALEALVSTARGFEIVAGMDAACMHMLIAPLLHGEDDGASDRAAAVFAAVAESGELGVSALCKDLEGDAAQPRSALAVIVAAVRDACSNGDARGALKRHRRTLAAAFHFDAAVSTAVLPSGLIATLTSAHAASPPDSAEELASTLAALASTPRGAAAVCAVPGAAEAAATALASTASAQLAAAARDGETLPGTAAWREARYAASVLGSMPRGAAALRAAGWHELPGASADAVATAPAFAAACTAVEALLADGDPGTLIALRRDGTAPAALLAALLARFADASRWPDAAGHASLAAAEGDAAALVTYPAALLLGPLSGTAAALIAAEGDASGGAGVLLPGLLRAADAAAFSAAAAADAMLRLGDHPAVARFRADVADM